MMQEKVKKAIIKLQKTIEPNTTIKFTHQAKGLDKSVTAHVLYGTDGKPTISVFSSIGYSEKYINAKLRSEFNFIIGGEPPIAVKDDLILIRELDSTPQPGDIIQLDSYKYYFAVNDSIIYCNGRQLGKNFQGVFTKPRNSVCSTGGAILAYHEFKLI